MIRLPLHITISAFLLVTWLASAEGDKPAVASHVDYATPLEQLHQAILETDLFHDRSRSRQQLETYLEKTKLQVERQEADEKLARRAYVLGRRYLQVIDKWDEMQEDLERIRNDSGLMKTADSERDQREIEERIARKTGNLASRWEAQLETWQYEMGQELLTVKEWQGRLDRAIVAGLVGVGDARQRSRPTQSAASGQRPPPSGTAVHEEEEPPQEPAVTYTFTMPTMTSRLGEDVKTPQHLLSPVTKTANWLEMQQRRIGGKLATRISAVQEERKVILSLQVTELFTDQDRATKQRFAETLQQFWATTCAHSGRIPRNSDAHVLITDSEQNVVVLSADRDGSVLKVMR